MVYTKFRWNYKVDNIYVKEISRSEMDSRGQDLIWEDKAGPYRSTSVGEPWFFKIFYDFFLCVTGHNSDCFITGKCRRTGAANCFLSKTLRDSELKYSTLEKQAYSLVKALKFFSIYILHSKIISYVLNAAIKYILT